MQRNTTTKPAAGMPVKSGVKAGARRPNKDQFPD